MEKTGPSCPVCTLYLREGITLQAHLETHPKEQVIEALLKATSGGSGTVQTSNSNFVPASAHQSFGATNTTFISPSQQYVNPQTQMTTAVTYQHFMTSNGSAALMPQYFQVPTIVAPNSSVPVIPNQSINCVPNQNSVYAQTVYNPLYNPYIPQPYPMTQPMFTGFPISAIQAPSESNTQVTSSQMKEKCTIATNTSEEMDLSDSKSEPSRPSSPKCSTNRRKVKKANEGKRKNESSSSSSKTSVITRAKGSKSKTVSPARSTSSVTSSSGMISPPPLTLINRSRSSSVSCSQTPPPPPLSKAPCYVKVDYPEYSKTTDSSQSTPVIIETECSSITKVTEYLRKHHDLNSVIVESGKQSENNNNEEEEKRDDEEQEDVEEIQDSLEIEDTKVNFVFETTNEDIPKEISSANIERNCDGSDIFIQQENIPFTESEDGSARVSQPEFVDVDANLLNNNAPASNSENYYDEVPYEANQRDTPNYTDLQPVTYTDLQPASSPRVFQDLNIPGPISFSNFMEVDGIRIYFNNNNNNNGPVEPIIKFTSKKSEKENDNPMMESVIQLVNSEKNDFPDSYPATTSQVDGHLDLPDLSPLTLNIQADESMPARGELSEQESLGAENSNWGLFHGDVESVKEWKRDLETVQNEEIIETGKSTRKSFKCSLCNEIFSCPKERRVHKNTVHLNENKTDRQPRKPRSFECVHCNEVFNCLRDRRLHIIQNHSESKKSEKIKEEFTESKNPDCENANLETIDARIKGEEEPDVKCESSDMKSQFFVSRNCTRCDFAFNSLKGLREHLREAHGEVRFKCGTCTLCFDEESEYNAHLKIHPLVCNQCGKTFYRKPNLNLHMKRHLDVKPYECSLCPKSFITRQKLEEHMNGHSGNKPIKCTLCDRTFGRHSNLIQHRNVHHLKVKKKIKDYVCRCGEVFHSLRKLEWHKEVHDSKPKTCPFCSQKFIHSASVTRHVRRSHMPDYLPGDNREFENVQCPICEKIYLRSSLMVHMRVHNGEKPFVCKICNKRFSTKWNLELHNWTHQSRSNMPFKCNICKSAFFRESDYIAHLNSHKNFKPFTCNICGQKFIRKYNCLRHQEEHKKAKRFVCTANGCMKSFHRSYYLKDHMKVHTGVRPHTCHICGKASSTKSNHNKHVRIHDTREPVNTEN